MILTLDFLDDLLKLSWISLLFVTAMYVGLAQYISAQIVGWIFGLSFIGLSSWRLLVYARLSPLLVPVNYGISVAAMTLLPPDKTTSIWSMALIPSVGLVLLEVALRKAWRYMRPRKLKKTIKST